MTPMTPVAAAMPTSMPVSPFERQLVAQVPPPVRPPVDPFLLANQPQMPPGQLHLPPGAIPPGAVPPGTVPPGTMPMHERLENMVNASSQPALRSASAASPYHPPLVAVQGGVPVNLPPPHHPQNNYGQHGPVHPNAVPSSNTPIPSGVSTLSPQNGYNPQHPHGNFHPNMPQPYHRVY